jgi:hypothetical protein
MFPITLTPEGQKAFRAIRAWLYGVTIAVLALLVYLDKISAGEAPLWLTVAGAVLGIASPTAALANLTPLPKAVDPDAAGVYDITGGGHPGGVSPEA